MHYIYVWSYAPEPRMMRDAWDNAHYAVRFGPFTPERAEEIMGNRRTARFPAVPINAEMGDQPPKGWPREYWRSVAERVPDSRQALKRCVQRLSAQGEWE